MVSAFLVIWGLICIGFGLYGTVDAATAPGFHAAYSFCSGATIGGGIMFLSIAAGIIGMRRP